MNTTGSVAAILSSCFGLSILSGFVPWISAEVAVLSCASMLRSPVALAALVLAATSGQIVGECILYCVGSRFGSRRLRTSGRLAEWRQRLNRGNQGVVACLFLSSAVGIPPLYLMTIAAGTSGMRFSRFLAGVSCGLFARFAVLAFCPLVVLQLVHAVF